MAAERLVVLESPRHEHQILTPEELLTEIASRLPEILPKLSPTQQKTVTLSLSGLGTTEIAQDLGLKIITVEDRLRRARRILEQSVISPAGYTPIVRNSRIWKASAEGRIETVRICGGFYAHNQVLGEYLFPKRNGQSAVASQNGEPETDIGLIQAARDGDQTTLTQLYQDYRGRIYRFVLKRTGNEAKAEEITAEVLTKAFMNLQNFRPQEKVPFSHWLIRIARNQIVNNSRSEARKPSSSLDKPRSIPSKWGHEVLPEDYSPLLATGNCDDPAAIFEVRESLRAVCQDIARLPKRQREIMVLRFIQGLSIGETARILSMSKVNVTTTTSYAIARLRNIRGKEEGTRK